MENLVRPIDFHTTGSASTSGGLSAGDGDGRLSHTAEFRTGVAGLEILPPDPYSCAVDNDVLCNVLAQIVRRLLNETSAAGDAGRAV